MGCLRLRSNRAPSVDVYVNDYVFLFVVNKQPSNPPQNGQSRPFDVSAILDADAVFLPCIEITDFGTGRRLRTAARGMYGFRLYEPAGVQLEPERIFVALVDYGFTDTKSPPASPSQDATASCGLKPEPVGVRLGGGSYLESDGDSPILAGVVRRCQVGKLNPRGLNCEAMSEAAAPQEISPTASLTPTNSAPRIRW